MLSFNQLLICFLLFSSFLASHEAAWQTSKGRPGFIKMKPLSDHMTWGTAATQHAASWPHVDDEGFATVASPTVGSKYWIVGRPRQNLDNRDQALGDMDSVDGFGFRYVGSSRPTKSTRTWSPGKANTSLVDYEGILLTPGSVL